MEDILLLVLAFALALGPFAIACTDSNWPIIRVAFGAISITGGLITAMYLGTALP